MSQKQTCYARGYVDEGNWFEASIETPLGSRGNLSFPLSCLPEMLQEQAKQGKPIWICVTIEVDDTRRIAPESLPLLSGTIVED